VYDIRMAAPPFDLEALPGGDLVQQGLEDLRRGVESAPALLVLSAGPRLRLLGIDVPVVEPSAPLPEHRLYQLLAAEYGDAAHGRYNALQRRIVSFARAAQCVH
jgi:hypothetical protein